MTDLATAFAGRNRQDEQRAVLLASMRVAIHNLRSWQAELEVIGVALSRDQITIDTAIDWLDNMDILGWLPPPQEIEATAQEVA